MVYCFVLAWIISLRLMFSYPNWWCWTIYPYIGLSSSGVVQETLRWCRPFSTSFTLFGDLITCSHLPPKYRGRHLHVYEFELFFVSTQVPPFWHGLLAQARGKTGCTELLLSGGICCIVGLFIGGIPLWGELGSGDSCCWHCAIWILMSVIMYSNSIVLGLTHNVSYSESKVKFMLNEFQGWEMEPSMKTLLCSVFFVVSWAASKCISSNKLNIILSSTLQ